MRTTKLFTSPGGNALQGLVCLSRLGVAGRLITKLGNDEIGRQILDTLRRERAIDTSRVSISPGNSPFSYIIVDEVTHTRTILHTPAELLAPNEIESSFLDGASILLNDGRQTHAGIRLTEMAIERGIPVLTDFDEELDQAEKMITLTDYLVLNSDHLLKRTGETDLLAAMASLLRALPRVRFVIATLGSQGSLLMRRPHAHTPNDDAEVTTRPESDEEEGKGEVCNMGELLERVPKYEDVEAKWQRMWAFGNAAADGDGDSELASATEEEQREADCALGLLVHTFCYRPARDHHAQVHYCPAYPLNPASIVDTTGAGDVFVGGVCYGLVRGLSLPQLLALASLVAARKCLGSGLDGISDRGSLPALLLRTPRAHD